MLMQLPNDGRDADYALELTEKEAEALRKVAQEADGRKSETKIAREALGIYNE